MGPLAWRWILQVTSTSPIAETHRIRVLSTDLTTPTVETIAITSNPVRQATYAANEVIRVAVTFSETVNVTGSPQLAIQMESGERAAVYRERHGDGGAGVCLRSR